MEPCGTIDILMLKWDCRAAISYSWTTDSMKQLGLNIPVLDVLIHRLRERDVSEWLLFLTSAQIKLSETADRISSLFLGMVHQELF